MHVAWQLAAERQQLDAGLLGVLDQRVRELPGEQRRQPAGLGGDGLDERGPVGVVEQRQGGAGRPQLLAVLHGRQRTARSST